MATDLATRLMTTEEFLQVADEEGVTRELIDGILVERPMTTRNPKHSHVMAEITRNLGNWLHAQEGVIGYYGCGEVRCRLATDPDLIVGIDIVYYAGAEFVRQANEESFFDGPPVIAVEVLSPTDKHEEIVERINRYLSHGVMQVWIADPDFQTVTVHRPKAEPELITAKRELTGEPELPGFRVRVADLFS